MGSNGTDLETLQPESGVRAESTEKHHQRPRHRCAGHHAETFLVQVQQAGGAYQPRKVHILVLLFALLINNRSLSSPHSCKRSTGGIS